MKIAGIITEYDPFHTGHAYQIARTREALGPDCAVAAFMSGNFVQRGAPALADKWLRARLALLGGVDLVVELPTLWAVSSAETFAFGGAVLLHGTGVVTHLCFGSECGDIEALSETARCLDSPEYAAGLRRFLDEGMPFAACRQAVVRGLLGAERAELLSWPNNNLGVEYLRALRRLNSSIRPMTVRREGGGHNTLADPASSAPHVSATQMRLWLEEKNWNAAKPYLVPGELELLRGAALLTPGHGERLERMVMARLRIMTAADWAQLPDSAAAEGLPDRLERAGRECRSLPEFYELAKTKRYSHARLRRMALWAFLGLRETDRPAAPPYLRVLAANERGREVLRLMKKRARLPLLTKPAHVRTLDGTSRWVLDAEARCTDLYGLCLPDIPPGGREWREGPVIL